MALRSFFLLLTASWMLVVAGAQAQEQVSRPWWITLGGGGATAAGSVIMSLGATYTKEWDATLLSVRILGATNDNPTVRRIDPSGTTYRLTDYGILYGPVWRNDFGYLSAGAGVGMVRTKIERGTVHEVRSGFSVPVEAQAFWQVAGSFGFGIYGFVAVNDIRTFSGVMLSVQMGVMSP